VCVCVCARLFRACKPEGKKGRVEQRERERARARALARDLTLEGLEVFF
jgi:hypothetical protein